MSFDKYHLMRDEEYNRLRQKQVQSYNPELRLLTKLDDDMNEILNDTTIPADVKVRIYDHIKQRFKDVKSASTAVKRKLTPPVEEEEEEAVSQALEEPVEERVDTPKMMDESVLEGVEDNRAKKAKGLLSLIQDNPHIIAVNKNNEIVLHGKPVKGSNYYNLFHSMYTHRGPTDTPSGNIGHSKFLSALNEINVPANLISSTSQYSKMVDLKKLTSPTGSFSTPTMPTTPTSTKPQKGKGLPPGIRRHMLRLYRV